MNKVSHFVSLFENLPDQRQEWKIRHKLVDILFIAVVATIADCDDWEEMEWFAQEKEDWFRQYLELPNGIPSHDTIQRVFSWLDPELFRQRFLQWVQGNVSGQAAAGVIAIDGKTMRGSRDRTKKALHVVNAWFSETGMVLGQVFTEEKSNEMTAIPELLEILTVAGHIVTIDAAGTYPAIAEKIVNKHGDYVLAVKGNQPNLMEDIRLFFETEEADEHSEYKLQRITRREKGHGRIETRTYVTSEEIGWLRPRQTWEGLKSIGMVRSHVEELSTGTIREETRYYISSLPAEVSRFAYAVRQHWGVESMHWVLDVTFQEDGRRSRKGDSAKNLSQLLRLTYDILKSADRPKNWPLKRLRKRALVDNRYLDRLVSTLFQ